MDRTGITTRRLQRDNVCQCRKWLGDRLIAVGGALFLRWGFGLRSAHRLNGRQRLEIVLVNRRVAMRAPTDGLVRDDEVDLDGLRRNEAFDLHHRVVKADQVGHSRKLALGNLHLAEIVRRSQRAVLDHERIIDRQAQLCGRPPCDALSVPRVRG